MTPEHKALVERLASDIATAGKDWRTGNRFIIRNDKSLLGDIEKMIAAITQLSVERDAFNEVLTDKRRLTRELDVVMHGEGDAAKQASLCDLIEPAKRMRAELARLRAELVKARAFDKQFIDGARKVIDYAGTLTTNAALLPALPATPSTAADSATVAHRPGETIEPAPAVEGTTPDHSKLREQVAAAYEAGATAVHKVWVLADEFGEGPPRGDPEFGEAARDYAQGVEALLPASGQAGAFSIGQRVEKFSGDYTATGEVRAIYTMRNGAVRYVVEFDAIPLNHILSERQLRPLPPPPDGRT